MCLQFHLSRLRLGVFASSLVWIETDVFAVSLVWIETGVFAVSLVWIETWRVCIFTCLD